MFVPAVVSNKAPGLAYKLDQKTWVKVLPLKRKRSKRRKTNKGFKKPKGGRLSLRRASLSKEMIAAKVGAAAEVPLFVERSPPK